MSTPALNQETHGNKDKRADSQHITLAKQVRIAMEHYFKDLDGHEPVDLYRMVIHEVEKPLLEAVMRQTQGNQSRAAEMLGLNRSTLRKKLQQHNIY